MRNNQNEIEQPHYSEVNRNYYNIQNSNINQQQQQQNGGIHNKICRMIFYLKQQQLTPQLLPYQYQLFKSINLRIKFQQQELKKYKNSIKNQDQTQERKKINLNHTIYSMEIQRYSYILKNYLKIRMQKIQKYSFYYFKNHAQDKKLMSENQIQFLAKYVDLRYKYYQKNVFKFFPKNFKGLGAMELYFAKPQQLKLINSNQSNSAIQQPDFKTYVFLKLNRNPNEFRYKIDIPKVQIPQEQSAIASANQILFIPYEAAKKLIERSNQEDVHLI